jgi:hypothetical protein
MPSPNIQKHTHRQCAARTTIPAIMSRPLRTLVAFALPALAVLGLVACGDSKSGSSAAGASAAHSAPSAAQSASGAPPSAASSEVVAHVGSVPITRAQVSNWMGAFAGTDAFSGSSFSVATHRTPTPEGLVSDPPNYPRCVAALEAAAAKSPAGSSKETGVQLLSKCRQLYQALRTQAIAYLIKVQKTISVGRDLGVSPTDAEVQQLFAQYKAREFPSEADFHRYLEASHRSVADTLVVMRLSAVSNGLLEQFKTPEGRAKINEAEQRWTAKTSCRAGYVVEGCKEYKGGATYPSTPPPAVLMEQVQALSTGRCADPAACGKQVGQ